MAEKRLFGNSIDESIVNELKRREKLLSKVDASNTDILPNDPQNLNSLRYTTQKGAWVRMISSVDVKEPTSNTFSPEVSKNFILTGGELTSTGVKKEGINFDNFDTTKSYRKTETLGVRPEAGITSFSIKHKGTYGSLRDAEISFNVWSKEDLNDAQSIYLRPGVHMIVEWGHTIDSELNPTKLPDINNYFNIPKGESETTASKRKRIQDLINKHREENLSYEAFIGLVTNFSWSFREDGGYDCSVKIISTGAVMESLTVIQGAGGVSTQELKKCMKVENSEEQDESKKSLMHNFVLGVKKSAVTFEITAAQLSITSSEKVKGSELGKFGKLNYREESTKFFNSLSASQAFVYRPEKGRYRTQRFSEKVRNILINNDIELYGFVSGAGDAEINFRYITVRDLLKFLNASEFFPNNSNGEETSKLFIEPESNPKSIYPKFKKFDEHFSLDIKTCILPKPPSSSNTIDLGFLKNIKLPNKVSNEFEKAIFKNESNNVQSILVELDFLLESFNSALSSDEEDIYRLNVYSFIKNLLKGINNALGNITDLDLHFDEIKDAYIIVDREAVVNKEDFKGVAQLSFTGIFNTVQKVSIQTKITPQLTSQIAISAQGTKSIKEGDNNSNLSMIQWNINIKDRFVGKGEIPEKKVEPACVQVEREERKTELQELQERLVRTNNLISNKQRAIAELLSQARDQGFTDGSRITSRDLEARKAILEDRAKVNKNSFIRNERELNENVESKKEIEQQIGFLQALLEDPFLDNFLKPWSDAFSELIVGSKKGWFASLGVGDTTTSYRADLFSKIRRFGISYFRDRYFKSIGGEQNEDKTSDPGLIPIELSITLDGIGGLKIGEVFKLSQVDRFLPDVYKDYGFIITGLDNAIENNKWNTTIRALTFKLPK